MRIPTFDQAIAEASKSRKPHLLLGNGFSIACRPNIFRYDRLFQQADFSNLSAEAQEAFQVLETMDFERVIKALRDTSITAGLYGLPEADKLRMIRDADALKELLVQTIASTHPASPLEITDDEYAACNSFLGNFQKVYTLNYDLLIYWTKMHSSSSDDGFRTSQRDIDTGVQSEYVVWNSAHAHSQDLHFLHGALHIFDSGIQIRKYTWKRTGIRLIEQIRSALKSDFFPLFVAEGTSDEKLQKIRHSDYLAMGLRSFEKIKGCLFVYGLSLAANDEHFLRVIEDGDISEIYVGLYGDPNSAENTRIRKRADSLGLSRRAGKALKVNYFDSASAKVWGK